MGIQVSTCTVQTNMAFKALLSSALFAAACAAPAGPPAYGAPAPYPAEPAYPDLPPVYKYTYAVKDDYSFSNFNAHEERDGYNALGGYQVALPDGRTQIVTYTATAVSTILFTYFMLIWHMHVNYTILANTCIDPMLA